MRSFSFGSFGHFGPVHTNIMTEPSTSQLDTPQKNPPLARISEEVSFDKSAKFHFVDQYWHFIGSHPILICVLVSGLSIFLSILGLVLHPPSLDANPEEAFKALKTDISSRLNTWKLIQTKLIQHHNQYAPQTKRRLRRQSGQQIASTNRSTSGPLIEATATTTTTREMTTRFQQGTGSFYKLSDEAKCVLAKLNHVFGFALQQSTNVDAEMPIRIAVYRLLATEYIYSKLQVNKGINDNRVMPSCIKMPNFTDYESISVCDLLQCGAARVLTSLLASNQCESTENIDTLLSYLGNLNRPRHRRENSEVEEKKDKAEKLVFCTAQKIFMSKEAWGVYADDNALFNKKEFYTTVYFKHGFEGNDSALDFYDKIMEHTERNKLGLEGLFMGERGTMEVFERTMWTDMKTLIPVTLVVVFIMMLAYTGSIFYSFVVLMTAGFSFTVSYYIYFLFFKTFWFTNYLGTVILLGIGADDCFVLVHSLAHDEEKAKNMPSRSGTMSNEMARTPGEGSGNGKEAFKKSGPNGHSPDAVEEQFLDKKLRRESRSEKKGWQSRNICCPVTLSSWMIRALKHASVTMFITSATTASAFLCNFITPVTGIKAFGIFAGTLVVVNYLLVVTLVPASLILKERYFDHFCGGTYTNLSTTLKKIVKCSELTQVYIFHKILPRFINWIKWPLSIVLPLSVAVSCIIIFFHPGLKKAQDSTQLFHDDNPIQWFQDKFLDEFDIQNPSQDENLHVVWGIVKKDTSDPLTNEQGDLQFWPNFEINHDFLKNQARFCEEMEKKAYKALGPEGCFAKSCQIWEDENKKTMRVHLQNCTRNNSIASEKEAAPGRIISGPYWSFTSNSESSYIQSFKKSFSGNARTCTDVTGLKNRVNSEFMEVIQSLDNISGFSDGWVVPSSHLAFRRLQTCDLQETLQKSTVIAVSIPVAIALGVVLCTTIVSQLLKSRGHSSSLRFIRTVATGFVASFTCIAVIACTVAMMALMRWKLNTVESVIIALCIGLSFDFTMHYAYAYVKQDLNANAKRSLEALFKVAGTPVLMSFLSTFTAGFVFIFSNAFPFYQVGLFMLIVTAWSWLGSTFLFTSAMITFDWVIYKIWASQIPQGERSEELDDIVATSIKPRDSGGDGNDDDADKTLLDTPAGTAVYVANGSSPTGEAPSVIIKAKPPHPSLYEGEPNSPTRVPSYSDRWNAIDEIRPLKDDPESPNRKFDAEDEYRSAVTESGKGVLTAL